VALLIHSTSLKLRRMRLRRVREGGKYFFVGGGIFLLSGVRKAVQFFRF